MTDKTQTEARQREWTAAQESADEAGRKAMVEAIGPAFFALPQGEAKFAFAVQLLGNLAASFASTFEQAGAGRYFASVVSQQLADNMLDALAGKLRDPEKFVADGGAIRPATPADLALAGPTAGNA